MDRRTLTMNWDALGEDDDDDRFFESCDRISSVVPLDLASSGSDDDEFDDSRMSFASAISSITIDDIRNFQAAKAAAVPATPVLEEYNLWMAEPGSIKDRRKRLLQGMGLTSNKDLLNIASVKLKQTLSKKTDNGQIVKPTVDSSPSDESKNELSPSTSPILLMRSRSDGDIESFSINTKKRKEELIGPISKQRLTRTSSSILTSHGRVCQYPNSVRISPPQGRTRTRSSIPNSGALSSILSSSQFGAFFLSKSFRYSKRRGVALLKNIKGVANSMSGLMVEKERESPPLDPRVNLKNSSSQWVKVRQHGKSCKEFTGLHLCQEIQAHEGSIWTIKFSLDGHYLASAGEDRVIHVWEVQECEVASSMRWTDDPNSAGCTPIHPSMLGASPDRPQLGELPPMPSERRKKGKNSSAKKKGNSIPDYVQVPETVFSLSEKPICSFTGHLDDVLDLVIIGNEYNLFPRKCPSPARSVDTYPTTMSCPTGY